MIYAGIGSRNAPDDMLDLANRLAQDLNNRGWMLRSGGAMGMDIAFEAGSTNSEIFRPRHATPEAIKIAEALHPAWDKCSDRAKLLHGRNAQIILGENLDDPVDCVLYWSVSDNKGGTAMALSIARSHNIPTYHLKDWNGAI